jgi:hypothetical protein
MFMKKPLRYLLTCVLLMAASGAWAGSLTATFDFSSGLVTAQTQTSPLELTCGEVKLSTVTGTGSYKPLVNATEWRFYKGNTATFTAPEGCPITSVEFTLTTNYSSNAATNIIQGDAALTSATWSNPSATSNSVTFSNSAQVRFSKVVVTYTSNKTAPNLAFSPTSVSIVKGNTATVTLTKATDATPTYTIDESIATYNSTTGVITGVSPGKTTLKASCDATSTYSAGDVSCTVVVLSPTLTTVTITTTEPYNEPLTTNLGSFTSDGVQAASTDVWSYNSTYSCAYATAHIGSTAYESSSKLTSPTIDLSNSSIKGVKLTFDHAGYSGSDMTKLTLWVKETSATSWTQLTIPTYFTSYTFVSSGDIILDAYAGKKIQVAFQYESTTAAAGTWEIKNFVVTGSATTNINVIKNDDAKDAPVYSTSGIRMNGKTLPAGVYVKNGKKFVVK